MIHTIKGFGVVNKAEIDTGLQSQMLCGPLFLGLNLWVGEPTWSSELSFLRESLCNVIILQFVGDPLGVWELIVLSLPLLPLIVVPSLRLSCGTSFLVGPNSFHWLLLCRQLQFCWAPGRSSGSFSSALLATFLGFLFKSYSKTDFKRAYMINHYSFGM